MTEAQAIIASGGGFILVTILGWSGVLWQRNRLNGREKEYAYNLFLQEVKLS